MNTETTLPKNNTITFSCNVCNMKYGEIDFRALTPSQAYDKLKSLTTRMHNHYERQLANPKAVRHHKAWAEMIEVFNTMNTGILNALMTSHLMESSKEMLTNDISDLLMDEVVAVIQDENVSTIEDLGRDIIELALTDAGQNQEEEETEKEEVTIGEEEEGNIVKAEG